MSKSRPSRALIYVRQSVFREESISLELQETACRSYAKERGYRIVGMETDAGVSGRTFNRPGVAAAMDAIERGDADVILLWKWSRLSRSRLDWYVAADRAEQAGGSIESATEPIDTSTSIGRLSRGMLIDIAAFESDRAGDQWREAHERRIRQGLPHTGKPRFGYIYDHETKRYEVDPVTGPLIPQLYSRYIDGESCGKLAQWLAANGVPTATGAQWAPASVKKLLDRGFAAGRIRFRGEEHEGIQERLIDEATWAAYQVKREQRRGRPRAEGSPYLLSGLIRCKTCNLAMSGARFPNRKWVYYRCDRNVTTKVHKATSVNAEVAEAAVMKVVERLAAEADRLADVGAPSRPPVNIDALRAEVAKQRAALTSLTVKHLDGSVSDEAYKGTATVIEGRLQAAQAALRDAEAAPALPAPALDTALHLMEDWDILPVHARREGLRAIIDHVSVDLTAGRHVDVHVRPGVPYCD